MHIQKFISPTYINSHIYDKVGIREIWSARASSKCIATLFTSKVQAGFPSPSDEYSEGSFDLKEYLLPHKETTFYVRVTGESMLNIGIYPNDMLVVDRSITPAYGHVIIALINGEMTVKRLEKIQNKLFLCSENDNFPDIHVTEDDDFAVWGVVTNVIHSLVPSNNKMIT